MGVGSDYAAELRVRVKKTAAGVRSSRFVIVWRGWWK
jgi:hypothetical protein